MSKYKLVAALIAGVMLIGCSASLDQHTFDSTPHQPTTVSLMDTTNDTVFWSMDVPVWCRLKLDFDREPERERAKVDPTFPATAMTWTIHHKDTKEVIKTGTENLCGLPFIIRVTYRDQPEIPDCISGNCLQVASNLQLSAAAPPSNGQYAPVQVTVNEPSATARQQAAAAPAATPSSSQYAQTDTTSGYQPYTASQPVAQPQSQAQSYQPAPVFMNSGTQTIDQQPASQQAAMPQPTWEAQPAPQPQAQPQPAAQPAWWDQPAQQPQAQPQPQTRAQPQAAPLPPAVVAVPMDAPRAQPQAMIQPQAQTAIQPQAQTTIQPQQYQAIAPLQPIQQQTRLDTPASPAPAQMAAPQRVQPQVQAPAQTADGRRAIPLTISTELLQQYDVSKVSILIEGVPLNARLSAGRDNGSGIWTLTGDQTANLAIMVPAGTNEDIQLMVIATAPTSDGDTASTVSNMVVKVDPMAAAR